MLKDLTFQCKSSDKFWISSVLFFRMGETARLWMDPGNFSHLGLWISNLGLKTSSNKGLGWVFGMEGFWEIKLDVEIF